MADLKSILSSFGMGQYHDVLVEAGFDSWETIVDITEDDLESLKVQRGHRRRLQQEIARTLKLADNLDDQRHKALGQSSARNESINGSQTNTKRHYDRKPVKDHNAPQRPLSAYVLFSNAVREELTDQNLSFVETSKIVGDRWHGLPDESKESWKQRASGPWDIYNAEMKQYQDTETYSKHQTYLQDFNASQLSRKRMTMTNELPGGINVSEPNAKANQTSSVASHRPAILKRLAPDLERSHQAVANVSPPTPVSNRGHRSIAKLRESSSAAHSGGFSHACELCKKKKLKCNGAFPSCARCAKSNTTCVYAGGVRDKDKRLAERLANTLNSWEHTLRRMKARLTGDDQDEINKLLLMYHRSESAVKTSSAETSSTSVICESTEDADGDSGGESATSDVGSMGSTDHINEASFVTAPDDGRIDAFLGQTATDNWVDRLDRTLKFSDTDKDTGLDYLSANHKIRSQKYSGIPANTIRGGLQDPEAGVNVFADNLDPYGIPPKASADSFVGIYFSTVHPCFPILSRAQFLRIYEEYYAFGHLNESSAQALVLLHLVLGIGAMYTYATQASVMGEDKYRLLSFARAKTAVLDAHVFEASKYEQVQLCCLGGLYLLVIDEINKAWTLLGFGVRSAQSLGMHLTNTTPNMTDRQKSVRLHLWFSVLSLERTVTVMTGRPSMVRDIDCTAVLPSTGLVDLDVQSPSNTDSRGQFGFTGEDSASPAAAKDANLFPQYVELTSLAESVLSNLYSASIRHQKWAALQSKILELDDGLSKWNMDQQEPFDTDPTRQGPDQSAARVALGMLFHSTRILINRPCLCRLDYRIRHQSSDSDAMNVASANRCIASARATLALIPDEPNTSLIYQGPLWWMGVHHLKRAATILILAIMFLHQHPSAAGADVLADSKKAINWLYAMGKFSSLAHSAWVTLSRLLNRTTQATGGDVSGVVVAEDTPKAGVPATGFGGSGARPRATGQAGQAPVSTFEEPSSMALDAQNGGADMFGDLGWTDWDLLWTQDAAGGRGWGGWGGGGFLPKYDER